MQRKERQNTKYHHRLPLRQKIKNIRAHNSRLPAKFISETKSIVPETVIVTQMTIRK